jgi:hypothetical protein
MRFRQKTFTALVLILLAHGAFAQERQFGAWAAGVNNGKTEVYAGQGDCMKPSPKTW